jgi:hypothetical protein
MPPRPKQQHYVTKAYLDGFLEPGCDQLVCYGRHKLTVFRRATQDLATQRNYHSFKKADGTWDDSLEQHIQKYVEDPGLAVLRLLDSGKNRLNWKQRDQLSLLIAAQRFRVPHLRKLIDSQNKETIRTWLSEYQRKEREIGFDPGQMIVGVSSGLRPSEKHEISLTKADLEDLQREYEGNPEQFSREHFMNLALRFVQIFRIMKWTVYYAIGSARFITSDCPAAMVFADKSIGTVAIGRPDCRILFPISRTSLLLMEHDLALIAKLNRLSQNSMSNKLVNRLPEVRIATASTRDVVSYNGIQADQASRWVFAGQQCDWLIPRLQQASKNVRQVVTVINKNLSMVSAVEGE